VKDRGFRNILAKGRSVVALGVHDHIVGNVPSVSVGHNTIADNPGFTSYDGLFQNTGQHTPSNGLRIDMAALFGVEQSPETESFIRHIAADSTDPVGLGVAQYFAFALYRKAAIIDDLSRDFVSGKGRTEQGPDGLPVTGLGPHVP